MQSLKSILNNWFSKNWMIAALELAIIAFVAIAAFYQKEHGNPWYTGFSSILILLGVIIFVIARLPKPKEDFPGQLDYLKNTAYRKRRAINWMLLGLTYAFLYWGRYNINPALTALGGKNMVATFNWIFSAGTALYGISFILNGPLTDRFGGRFSILVGAIGAALANIGMGIGVWLALQKTISPNALFWCFVLMYPANMYFQSFGAVAIVKCNAPWFHVNERGVFGAVFGILISLGIYFAFDWTTYILNGLKLSVHWAFFIPAVALFSAFAADYFIVRNKPSEAGFENINTGDATANDLEEKPDPYYVVFKEMFKNPVIIMIAIIEFCSGFLRQAIMQIYRFFAKSTGETASFVFQNWGLALCCAGILGGVFAGTLSDHLFKSKRGPVVAVLYCGMLLGSIGMCFALGSPVLGWLILFMSLCVIGVHGMMSGVATMDFGGSKNTGIAVGIVDGFVYAGTALQAALYAVSLPKGPEMKAANAWLNWPLLMIPFAVIGLTLGIVIRNKKPKPKEK